MNKLIAVKMPGLALLAFFILASGSLQAGADSVKNHIVRTSKKGATNQTEMEVLGKDSFAAEFAKVLQNSLTFRDKYKVTVNLLHLGMSAQTVEIVSDDASTKLWIAIQLRSTGRHGDVTFPKCQAEQSRMTNEILLRCWNGSTEIASSGLFVFTKRAGPYRLN